MSKEAWNEVPTKLSGLEIQEKIPVVGYGHDVVELEKLIVDAMQIAGIEVLSRFRNIYKVGCCSVRYVSDRPHPYLYRLDFPHEPRIVAGLLVRDAAQDSSNHGPCPGGTVHKGWAVSVGRFNDVTETPLIILKAQWVTQ